VENKKWARKAHFDQTNYDGMITAPKIMLDPESFIVYWENYIRKNEKDY
jgi:hypothetical protein